MTEPPAETTPLDPLAVELARLVPSAPSFDRDRVMFAAGAASRIPTIRLWQLTAGFLAAMGFAAGVMFHHTAVRDGAKLFVPPTPEAVGKDR